MNANKIATKTIAVIVAVVMLVACGAVSAYAFFTSDLFKQLTGQIGGGGDVTTVEIGSYAEFYKYACGSADGGLFNDGSQTTDKTKRIVFKLVNDITIEDNLVVTADCHIDLNGKTLYLNGNYLVLSHAYYGSTIVKNGKIVLDKYVEKTDDATTTELVLGKLYFVTPNAAASVEDVSFALRSGTAKTAADCVVDLGANQAVLAYNALRIVTNKLANGVDGLVNTPDFDTLAAKTDMEFAADTLLYAKACYADGDSAEKHACVFAFADLDLPTHILAYQGYTVEYSSDNAVLTDFGKITPSASGIGTANLTVKVKHNGTIAGQTTLRVHIVDVTSNSQLLACGKSLVNAYMAGFYSQQESTYLFKRSTQLPRKVGTAGHYAELAYKTFSDAQLTNEVTDTIKTYDNHVMLEPTSAVKYLQVTVTANGNSSTLVYSVTASDAGLVRTQASYAQDFVVENYGGKIVLSQTGDLTAPIPDFTTKELLSPTNGNAHQSIQSITYSLINDTNGLYELLGCDQALTATSDNGTLKVADGKNPLNYIQTVQLNCKFVFEDGEVAEIQIPIECTSDQSENINPFLVHYNNYDQMFFTNTACYTTKTFEMPFATGDGVNDYIVCYDMLSMAENTDGTTQQIWNTLKGIAVSLYYNGQDHFLTASLGEWKDYANYVNALNAHLDEVDGTSRNKAVKKILDYGDSKWVFHVYTSQTNGNTALPDYNQNFEFVYNYRLVASSGGNFTRYDDSSDVPVGTAFTLPGILIYNANTTTASDGIITDINMYTWMYETFGTDNDGYQSGKVVLTDWLKQSIAVDVTSGKGQTYLANASNLNGLQYIVGATYVNLSGMNLAADYEANLGYISQMAAVETLILQNCKLSTVGGISANNPVDNILTKLTELKSLTTLKLDNKYNVTTNANTIYSFEFLMDIPTLNRVYVSNNLNTSTVAGIFYGAEGLVNMAYFDELVGAGVTVYNVNAGSDVAFTETTGINDYKTLQGIEYQSKLKDNQSIEIAYASFIGATPTDFGLKKQYSVGNGSYTVSNSSISWSYEGTDPTTSTKFYVNYTFTLAGTTVTIRVGFDVVRVSTASTREAGI